MAWSKIWGSDLFALCSLAAFHGYVLRQVAPSPSIPIPLRYYPESFLGPGGSGISRVLVFPQLQEPPAHSDLTDKLTPPHVIFFFSLSLSLSSFSISTHPTESTFSRRVEGKAQNHFEENNSSSQNSSGECACDVTSHVASTVLYSEGQVPLD